MKKDEEESRDQNIIIKSPRLQNEVDKINSEIDDAIRNGISSAMYEVPDHLREGEVILLRRYFSITKGLEVLLCYDRNLTKILALLIRGWGRFK